MCQPSSLFDNDRLCINFNHLSGGGSFQSSVRKRHSLESLGLAHNRSESNSSFNKVESRKGLFLN